MPVNTRAPRVMTRERQLAIAAQLDAARTPDWPPVNPPERVVPVPMSVRLAVGGPVGARGTGLGWHDPAVMPPAVLVSYVYFQQYSSQRQRYNVRDWVLDSGAFSAHASGKEIRVEDYIAFARNVWATDNRLVEVFALDVIGDWRASMANAETMWHAGVQCIPTYHYGSPVDNLLSMARQYPKIALGGAVGLRSKEKLAWARKCFDRVWPKKIHGFGFGGEAIILALPWHSVDATNWELAPCRYGTWRGYGGSRISVRGAGQNLRTEVEHYLRIERRARAKFRHQLNELEGA